MADYQPLDISGWCNAGVSLLGEVPEVALGRQTFRGLPFLIGAEDGAAGDRCYISFGDSNEGVTVPINETAQRVVVAHRLLETKVTTGGPLGIEVAEYVFHYADGGEERVAIRERFEIGLQVEREFMPRLCCHADAAIKKAAFVVENLTVNTGAMRRNLDATGGG